MRICRPSTGEQSTHGLEEQNLLRRWSGQILHLPISVQRLQCCCAEPAIFHPVFETTMPGTSRVPLSLLVLMSRNRFTSLRPQIILQIIYTAILKKGKYNSLLYSPLLQHGEKHAIGRKCGTVTGYEKIFPSWHKKNICRQTATKTESASHTPCVPWNNNTNFNYSLFSLFNSATVPSTRISVQTSNTALWESLSTKHY